MLRATISALAVAVILLGIPLAVLAAQIVKQDALRDLDLRTTTAARALEVRYRAGETITEDVLNSYVSESQARSHLHLCSVARRHGASRQVRSRGPRSRIAMSQTTAWWS
ncbi:hypothetical protein GCM10025876_26870 [Demequina litorisediminis]|uniref:Uncharacterized protein n=1 Tax=Demequina litorisediminis TaxID=1849022 RepID=A0ABQ6IID3_9MICO|nr:hypothetical protein GCM10025876_26870 [Demequina litorisediminis]